MTLEDVDLRFVLRPQTVEVDGAIEHVQMVRVLQWRKKECIAEGDGKRWFQWTEWEDVPLVAAA